MGKINEELNVKSVAYLLNVLNVLKDEGIDIRSINIYKERSKERLLLKDIKQPGIDINEIIEKHGLDGEFSIGSRIHNMRNAYRGQGNWTISEEDKKEVERLGMIYKKSGIEELVEVLNILKNEGVDITLVPVDSEGKKKKKFLLKDIQQYGVNIDEIIEKYNLNGEYPIGRKLNSLRVRYNGHNNMNMTEEQKRQIEEWGLLQTKNSIEIALDLLELLQSKGVDVRKINVSKLENGKLRSTVLKDINQYGVNIDEIIEMYNLDPEYNIGLRISDIRKAIKGKNFKLSGEKKQRIEKLGIANKKLKIEDALEIIEKLKAEGVDLRKIEEVKLVNGSPKSTVLNDIKQDGIDIQEIIEKYNLDGEYKIGLSIRDLRRENPRYHVKDADEKKAELLKVAEKEDSVKEVLGVLEILKNEGVDIKKIPMKVRKGDKREYVLLNEIVQPKIDIKEIIKKYNLDPQYPIGMNLHKFRTVYRRNKTVFNEEERKKIESLDIAKRTVQKTNSKKYIKIRENVSEITRILNILDKEGVDVRKIPISIKIDGKKYSVLLTDIEQRGINIENIIKKNNLDPNYPIGTKIWYLRSLFDKYIKFKANKEDVEKINELGVLERKTSIEETIEILELLQSEGLELKKKKFRMVKKGKGVVLKDLQQDGLDIKKIIRQNRLDRDYPIGKKIIILRTVYNTMDRNKMNDNLRERAENLGVLKITELELEQAGLIEKIDKAKQLKEEVEKLHNKKEINH